MKITRPRTSTRPKVLDNATYVMAVAIPVATLPQAYEVIVGRIEGVSLTTWSFYLFASILFAYFGVKHKQKLLILMYIPMAIIEIVIVAGLIAQKGL